MTMESVFEDACRAEQIAGAVLLASNTSGTFTYEKAFGVRTLDPAAGSPESRPALEPDTLLRIASGTKLITSIAAMQCVERGLLGLDDDVRQFDPDLRDIQLLTSFDDKDSPVLAALNEKLTLRRLLSHSSGFNYEMLSPLLQNWRKTRGEQVDQNGPKLTGRFLTPLVSEPGTEWCYSPGIDWVGRIVERVTNETLEDYVRQNIAAPLGVKKMTFFPQRYSELLKGHADMTKRDGASGKAVHAPERYWEQDPDDALGGLGLFTTAEDFFKVLTSLLKDDGKLLSPKTLEEMMSPQLTPSSKESLKRFLKEPWNEASGMGGNFPVGCERDHTLAGMYLVEDLPVESTPRRPGTVAWMGYPNFRWFIDPSSGLCALFASQLSPSDDKGCRELDELFGRTMYERMAETTR